MLATPIESICFIILKAREFDAKVAPVDEGSGSNPADDAAVDVLEDRDDSVTEELAGAIDALDPKQQAELVALTWVGRGDFEKSEWRAALKAAREAWTTHTAAYLTGDPQLGDLLEERLAQLGYSCSEVEARHL
jgi:hypothetical protein